MNTNNYTIKSQEALQNAVQLAQSKGQQAIETGHLLKAVINVGENVTHFISINWASIAIICYRHSTGLS